ncbi:hypothetical protein [Nocardia higoensis]|uniref:hypothetical protein n=1 Tax=Nocardia higoensis TaxID=228599 RepID=UPI0002DE6CCE|nr:hypothetical protein [Nocardia higoensis]
MNESNPRDTPPGQTAVGAAVLQLNPQALIELDSACSELAAALVDAQGRAAALGALTTWGLGEDDPALRTARALVNIFREKASGGPGSAHSVLGRHLASTEELRGLFATVATALPQVDEEFAQEVRQIDS